MMTSPNHLCYCKNMCSAIRTKARLEREAEGRNVEIIPQKSGFELRSVTQ